MKNNKQNTKGISLIVLVITILVIVVLAGAVILTVSNNNPLSSATEAVYKSDLKNFLSDLNLYTIEELGNGNNIKGINAKDEELVKYIPTIKGKTEYIKVLQIVEGKLYILRDEIPVDDQDRLVGWAEYVGIGVLGLPTNPIVTKLTLEPGTDKIKAKVEVTESASGIVNYIYEISEDKNTWKKEEVTTKEYIFTGLKKQTKYYIKVTAVDNNSNKSEPKEGEATTGDVVIEEGSITFDVNPKLGEGVYTNQDVTVAITYPEVVGYKGQYSYDGLTWSDYTTTLTITKNLTIYTRMIDEGGNETDKHPTQEINKIDKLQANRFTPTVTEVNTNTLKITGSTADATATADNGSSGIKGYQYKINGGTWTTETTNTEYTFTGLDSKVSHTLLMRAIDKAGNVGIEESVNKQIGAISDAITFTLNPNVGEGFYTNQNITVTISYPNVAGTTKQVSYDGLTWTDYTTPLTITTNKTVYAKLVDSATNESKAKTVEINKIDKLVPNIPSINLNGYIAGTWTKSNITITYTGTDKGATKDNASSGIAKYQSTTNGTTWTDLGANYIVNLDTTGINLQIRVVDNAGNISSATTAVSLKRDASLPTITNVTSSNITEKSIDVTVVASDSLSGIRGYKISKDNGTNYTTEQSSNVFSLTGLSANSTYNIKVQVIDNVGNTATSNTYVFTTLAPQIFDGNRTYDGGTASYSNPTIPKGFKPVDTDRTTWNNKGTDYAQGLVIEDTNGNQFVWVPASKYGYSGHYGATAVNDLPIGTSDTNQINKYGGFWIARFESSNNGNKVASKKNTPPWTNIKIIDSKARAEAYGPDYGMNYGESWTSSLMTGFMWDTTCKWIASDGTNVNIDSKEWGNYTDDPYTGDNGVMNTGSNENFMKKNIYDLAR